jgi:hypothetical protein
MPGDTLTLLPGLLLIVVPLGFNALFFLLQRRFDYPEILRRPTEEVLSRFAAGGPSLRATWYAFAFTALLFIPIPVLLHQVFGAAPWYLTTGTVLGVLAGLVQLLGLMRWPFLVYTLAGLYAAPDATPATKDAVKVVFEAFHRYIGAMVGEHLGYFFTALWSLIVCAAIIETGIVSPLIGWAGILPALGVLAGVLEEAGWKPAAVVNAIAYILWSLWMIALGIALLVAG